MVLEDTIRAGDVAAATELLRSGVDVNHRITEGLAPLMLASVLGEALMVELLLEAGAEVLALEPHMGATALHKAVQNGDSHVVAMLLDRGAFIDQQSPILGNTPLIDAVLHKQEVAVQLLLDRGARTTIRNHWLQSALDLARHDSLKAIVRLIEEREAADAARVAALQLSAAIKAEEIREVERLIAGGAFVNERAPVVGNLDDEYTPLGLAARAGRADIVRMLLDAGADPSQTTGLMKGTSVHEAAYFGHAEVIRATTDKRSRAGAPAPDLDAQGQYNGLTALHDAVWHGHLEAARALVEAGARLHLRAHTGLTPRELALLYGYDELAQFLARTERD